MNNPFDKESWTEQEKEIINAGGWQCSFCASINPSYVTSCACGHNQDDTYENLHGRYVPRPDEEYTEQQPVGEPVAEVPAEEPIEGAVAPIETTFEEIPSAPAEPAFEEIPDVPAEPAFEEIPAAPAEPTFEETLSPANALVEESSTEENTAEASTEIEPIAEVEPAPAPASEPVSAIPPVRKPVSKTNKPMEEYTEYEQGILNDGGWECAFCERINASYITTCACGHSEDDSFMKRRGKYKGSDADEAEQTAAAPVAPAATGSVAPAEATVPTATAVQAAPKPAELTPAEMIAEIEQELAADSSEMAKFRAIRKYKNLVKKGYMTKDEFNKRQDELLSFEDEDVMAAPESSGEDNA